MRSTRGFELEYIQPADVFAQHIASLDFQLFCLLKKNLGGQQFTSNTKVQTRVHEFLKNLDKNVYYCGIHM